MIPIGATRRPARPKKRLTYALPPDPIGRPKYRQRTCAECACDFTPTNAAQKFCVEHTRSKRLRKARWPWTFWGGRA